MSRLVPMDMMCELASAIVERQWRKDNPWGVKNGHSFTDSSGDIRYIDEVQDEFNTVLDIIDSTLNGDSDE